MNVWDATPVEQAHNIKLTIHHSSKWVIAFCLLAGFFAGIVLYAQAGIWTDDSRVKSGLFEHKQRVFRLVEIKPGV